MNNKKNMITSALCLAFAISVGANANEQVADETVVEHLEAGTTHPDFFPFKRNEDGSEALVEVFIELNSTTASSTATSQTNTTDRTSRITRRKQGLAKALGKFKGRKLVNIESQEGLGWSVRPSDIQAIKALPEVNDVYSIIEAEAHLNKSVPSIGVPKAWELLGNGDNGLDPNKEPVDIAIIDSGIDYYHGQLGGSGVQADHIVDDPKVIESGTFPTERVVDGYDFAGANRSFIKPDNDPIGQCLPWMPDKTSCFHGTHVAATAAGDDSMGHANGVAPGARLHAYKVFADNGGSSRTAHLALQKARDPNGDGDKSDHIDVVNLSLGSNFGLKNSISAREAQKTAEAGTVVVASAGNSGTSTGGLHYIMGSPAVASKAIAVASSTVASREQGIVITSSDPNIDGIKPAAEGAHPNRLANNEGFEGELIKAKPFHGCTPLVTGTARDVNGKVAYLTSWSPDDTCTFDMKYRNAQDAGAIGIVVMAAYDTPNRFTMQGIGDDVTIQGLMVDNSLAKKLVTALKVGPITIEANKDLIIDKPAKMSNFSSRGPGDNNVFKPDVTAPGSNIWAAFAGSGDQVVGTSGTSMASPHVAGVAALLKQRWPELSSGKIKAMIQNTSLPIIDPSNSKPYPLTRQGVGLVRADKAAQADSVVYPAGVSFKSPKAWRPTWFKEEVTIENLSDMDKMYSIAHEPNQTVDGIEVKVDKNMVYVHANSTATLTIKYRLDPQNTPENENNSLREVDGWFVLTETMNGEEEVLRVGYQSFPEGSSSTRVRAVENGVKLVNREASAGGKSSGFTLAYNNPNVKPWTGKIESVGYRTTWMNRSGNDAIEFAIKTGNQWETPYIYAFVIDIDSDEDGTYDHQLFSQDLGKITGGNLGIMYSFKYPSNIFGTYTFEEASAYDFNSRTFQMKLDRYTTAPSGFRHNRGFLDRGDNTFNFRAYVVNTLSGWSEEPVYGSVDLADQVRVQKMNVNLAPGEEFSTELKEGYSKGDMLWIHKNNVIADQGEIVTIK